MNRLGKVLSQSALAALIGVGALTGMAGSASAYVVCNRIGECWHVRDHYHYPRHERLVVHEDSWAWHGNGYHWREHQGRGYWHGGVWIGF